MIPYDYHIHTNFSCDSEATMMEMCEAAIELGIFEIGFTDHLDFIPQDPCSGFLRIDAWWEEIRRCRERFNETLIIRAGIEIGEPHLFGESVQPIIDQHPWDYCLGSLHWVGEGCVFFREYFEQPSDGAYRRYFQELREMVERGDFDILGHLDVVKRYGFDVYGLYDPYAWEKEIRAVLRECVDREIALEINTATLRRSVGEPTPTEPILSWYQEEGGRWLTIGSDAHEPENIGYGLDDIVAMIRKVGFQQLARLEARQTIAFPLSEAEASE
ncbi:MAG: histidinol-phosphatase HisJ family protein [Anaerolineales bacterium]|nr:histidinol-phosphatase HisJ family protein [Anaerolineales bacterium]